MKLRHVLLAIATAAALALTTVPTAPVSAGKGGPLRDPISDITSPCRSIMPEGESVISFPSGGIVYTIRVFVPSGLDRSTRPPLVMNWHGLGSNAADQASITEYEVLAERQKFVTVHALGKRSPNPFVDNLPGTSWELFDDQDPNRDDVQFADDLITAAIRDACVDPHRVYSTGMSNGGLFTSRLLCELGDRIAAGVAVAASYQPDDCTHTRAVPYRAYHGTADSFVTLDGSGSLLITPPRWPAFLPVPQSLRDFFDQDIRDEFTEFTASSGCRSRPTATATDIGETFTAARCPGNVPIELVIVDGMEHVWPRDQATVDATVDGWAFMQQFSLQNPR